MKDNSHLKNYTFRTYFFYVCIVMMLAFMIYFPRISLPMGLAYIITLTLEPFKTLYFKSTVKQRKKIIPLLVGLFVLLLIPIIRIIGKMTEEIGKFNQYLPKVEAFISTSFFKIQLFLLQNFKYRIDFDVAQTISLKLAKWGQNIIIAIPGVFGSLLEWFFLVPLFLYFFLKEKHRARELLFKIIPNQHFEKVYMLTSQFHKKFADYIVAKFIEAMIVGTLIYLGLMIISFPSPAMLAIFAGVMNIVPYVGPILGVIPAIVVLLIDPTSLSHGWQLFFVYLVANLIDMVLVFPLIVSKIVNLHPLLLMISVIVGSQLGGVVGMIVAVPFGAFIKIIIEEIYKDTYPQG